MFTVKTLLSLVTLVAAAAYVLAQPHRKFLLKDVANTTMCPIHVEDDINPNRIPRVIKFLKCASSPNRLCSKPHITHCCYKHQHTNTLSECVEIYDWVPVKYHNKNELTYKSVSVGCTCLIEQNPTAFEEP